MSSLRVLITDVAWPDIEIEREVLAGVGAEVVMAERGDEEELCARAPDADAILVCWRNLSTEVLERARRCRIVSRYGIGLDNIPVQRATELGILVARVPDFCVDEVAEHVMALILASTRGLLDYVRSTADGEWNQKSPGPVLRLRGKTLGLVGYGNLARGVVPRALGFGLEVIAFTPRLSQADVGAGVSIASSLDELLERSDFVSLHLPLTPESRHLIDADALKRMKPGSLLINTSRGAIVDESALLDALETGQIGGAALDVLDPEPPDPHNSLLRHPRVLITPHVAFYSSEAVEELQRRAAQHVARVFVGKSPPHLVNPQVLNQHNCRLSMS